MTPKKHNEVPRPFQSRLDQILNMKHPLCILAQQIEWEYFEKEFGPFYSESQGSPGKPMWTLGTGGMDMRETQRSGLSITEQ